MKNLMLKFRMEFFHQLDKKSSWGTKELKDQFIISLNNVLLDNTSYDEDESL